MHRGTHKPLVSSSTYSNRDPLLQIAYVSTGIAVTQPTAPKHWKELKALSHPQRITHWPLAFLITS